MHPRQIINYQQQAARHARWARCAYDDWMDWGYLTDVYLELALYHQRCAALAHWAADAVREKAR